MSSVVCPQEMVLCPDGYVLAGYLLAGQMLDAPNAFKLDARRLEAALDASLQV